MNNSNNNISSMFSDPSASPQASSSSSWILQSPNKQSVSSGNNVNTSPLLAGDSSSSPSSHGHNQFHKMNANSPPFLPSSSLIDSFTSNSTATASGNSHAAGNAGHSSALLNDSIENHLSGVFQNSLSLNSNNHGSPPAHNHHYNFLNDPLFSAGSAPSASQQQQTSSGINSNNNNSNNIPLSVASNVAPSSYISHHSAAAGSASSQSSTHSSFDNSFIPQPPSLSSNQQQMSPSSNNQQSSSFNFPIPFELSRRHSFNADLFINNSSSSPSNITIPVMSNASENNTAATNNSSSSSSSTSINNNNNNNSILIPPMLRASSSSTSSIPLVNNTSKLSDSNRGKSSNDNVNNASLLDSTIDENIAFSVASSLSQQLDELDPTSTGQQPRLQQQQSSSSSSNVNNSNGMPPSNSITTTTLTYRSSFSDAPGGNSNSLLNPPNTAPLNSYQSMASSMASALQQQRGHHHLSLQQSQPFTPSGMSHSGSMMGGGSNNNNNSLLQGTGGSNGSSGNSGSRFSHMMPHTAMASHFSFDSPMGNNNNNSSTSQFSQQSSFIQPMSATSYNFPQHSQYHHHPQHLTNNSPSSVSTPTVAASSGSRGLLGSHNNANNTSHHQNASNRLHLFNNNNEYYTQSPAGNVGRDSVPNTPQTPMMMNGNPVTSGASMMGNTPSTGTPSSNSSGNGMLVSTPTMVHSHNGNHHTHSHNSSHHAHHQNNSHHQQQHTNNGNSLDNGLLLVNNHIVTSPELRAMYRTANKYFCVDKVQQVYSAIKTLLDPMAPYAPRVAALISFLKKKNDIGNYTISGGPTGNTASSGNGSPSMNTNVNDFASPMTNSGGNGKYKLLSLVCSKSGKIDVLTISPNSNLLLQKHDLVIVEGDRGKDLVHVVEPTVGLNFVILLNFLKKREHLKSMGAGPSIVNNNSSPHHHHHHHHGGNASGLVYAQDDESVVSLPTKQILRFASSHEVSQLPGKLKNEIVAFKIALDKLNQLNVKSSSPLSSTSTSVASAQSSSDPSAHHSPLNLRIFNSEYQFDKKKLIFYYSCAKRNDFRDLIKELFKIYKTRIWLSAVLNPDEYSPYSEGNVASRALLQNNLKNQVSLSSMNQAPQQTDIYENGESSSISDNELKYMFNSNNDEEVKRQKYEERINTILKIDENGNAIDFGFEDIVVDDFHAQNLFNSIETLKIDLNIS